MRTSSAIHSLLCVTARVSCIDLHDSYCERNDFYNHVYDLWSNLTCCLLWGNDCIRLAAQWDNIWKINQLFPRIQSFVYKHCV